MKKATILFLSIIIILSACKKSFLDVNQNPNQPTSVTPNVVLSAALDGSAHNIANDFLKVNNLMGYWSRSGNYVADGQTESYAIPNDYTNFEWGDIFSTLNRYDYIEKQGIQNKLPFYVGVAKTMKAFHFSSLVDVYGDVPYSQAFDVAGKVQPKYDKGQDIYNDLIKQLDSAVTYFDNAKDFYANQPAATAKTDDQYDIMFGRGKGASVSSRLDKWVKLANTIKLKLLLHEYRVIDDTYRATEIQKITANGRGFIAANQSASVNPGYANSPNQISPFFGNFNTTTGPSNNAAYYRANTYAVNFYISTGDERQISFYVPVSSYNVVGNYDGDPNAVVNTKSSAIGGGYGGTAKSASQDQLILSDFESLFIQAEAAQRGWLPGATAQPLYESAVTQNFIYLDPDNDPVADAADAADYLAGNGLLTTPTSLQYVNWAAATDKIALIMTQKWASMNSINWVEAWTDYRRTGFPVSTILGLSKAASHVQEKIPIRYLYPQTELNTNAANVPTQTTADLFNTPIFWDK